jgi:hypothetical protein
MNDIVSSRFTLIFLLQTIVGTLVVIFAVAACVVVSIERRAFYNQGQLSLIAIFCIILIYININSAIRSLIKITVAPEGLIIKYLITQKRIIIDYADIIHVSNLDINEDPDNMRFFQFSTNYLRLVIELTTGEKLIFTDGKFANYDDLKDAIRLYRYSKSIPT